MNERKVHRGVYECGSSGKEKHTGEKQSVQKSLESMQPQAISEQVRQTEGGREREREREREPQPSKFDCQLILKKVVSVCLLCTFQISQILCQGWTPAFHSTQCGAILRSAFV